MSHANIVATVAGVSTVIPNLSKNDVYLAYLPLAHILELAAEVRALQAPISTYCEVLQVKSWNEYRVGSKWICCNFIE